MQDDITPLTSPQRPTEPHESEPQSAASTTSGDAQSLSPQPIDVSSPYNPILSSAPAPKSKRKCIVLIVVAVLILLAAAAAYMFAVYLPSRPANVYKAGLQNTGKALDMLAERSKEEKNAYTSVTFDGSLTAEGDKDSFDLAMSGAADKSGNMSATMNANVMGEKIQGELRSVVPKDGKALTCTSVLMTRKNSWRRWACKNTTASG